MKFLKILTLAVFCCTVINMKAQNTSTAQQRTDYIKQHISGISSDQESKILSIEQSCSTAMHGATNMHAKDSIRRSTDSQMKQVLTPNQYSQYKKIKKNLPKDNTASY